MNTSPFVPLGDAGKNCNAVDVSTTETAGLLRSVFGSIPRVRKVLAIQSVEKTAHSRKPRRIQRRREDFLGAIVPVAVDGSGLTSWSLISTARLLQRVIEPRLLFSEIA
jgi:hypothetical protein